MTPLIKGAITGAVMLAVTLLMYYAKIDGYSPLQYIIYVIYAAGIVWTLIDYTRSPSYTGRFPELFGQGFRCFVIVTLIMVSFTGIFSKMNPQFAEESAVYYKEDLVKQKNKTPAEIEELVAQYKKQFTTGLISTTIFGYLIVGTVFTAAGAGLLLLRRK